MQESDNTNRPNNYEEIDLRELFHILLKEKWIILYVTAFVSAIGVIFSLLLPNVYESKAILVPINTSSSMSGALQNYSGLAGLAGISLPSSGDEGNSEKAKKKITSLSFFENNILTNINLPDIMAIKSWNYKTNTIVYDKNIYDIDSNTWTRDYSYPQRQIPSAQESFEEFKTNHLRLSEDKKTGFVTLSIKHQAPFIAKQYTELIVDEINSFYRQKDKLESERAVSYLNQQILMTGLSEIKEVLAQLLQEETKKLALIEANEFYVFDYIDPPAVMEEKSEPRRALICILSALLGVILSFLLVLIKHYTFSKK